MMMMSYIALGVVGIVYVLWGWSMGWGGDGVGNGNGKLIANPFDDVRPRRRHATATTSSSLFQLTFAVITAALISGAIADRVKLSAWIVFVPLWVTLVLLPARPHGLRRQRRRARSARKHSAPRTTPAARSCTSTPVSPAWCWR